MHTGARKPCETKQAEAPQPTTRRPLGRRHRRWSWSFRLSCQPAMTRGPGTARHPRSPFSQMSQCTRSFVLSNAPVRHCFAGNSPRANCLPAPITLVACYNRITTAIPPGKETSSHAQPPEARTHQRTTPRAQPVHLTCWARRTHCNLRSMSAVCPRYIRENRALRHSKRMVAGSCRPFGMGRVRRHRHDVRRRNEHACACVADGSCQGHGHGRAAGQAHAHPLQAQG